MKVTVDRLFEQANVTTREVAAKTGLTVGRVEAIYWGRWLPSPRERQVIAEACGVHVDDVEWGHTMSPRNIRYHRFGLPEDF